MSTQGQVNVASNNHVFSSTGVISNPSLYEFTFGVRVPPASGPGVFGDPQRVVNAANYALGYPLSPGGFFAVFGTRLAIETGAAPTIPFPTTLHGVSVTVNGVLAPLYYVSPGLISGVVPFSVAGGTATVIVTSNGVVSNSVQVPLARSAPGIFTLLQNGLSDGATLHADYSVVNTADPAKAGEIVEVFLTGLGPVSPTVQDGNPGPATEPFANVLSQVVVTIDDIPCTIHFKGLAPLYVGLYQVNIQVPTDLAPGTHRLAIQTPESFSSMATIVVGP